MPKVSVVMPAYNFGRFLGEAIQSVLDQTFEDFEVIVVDDGSTDNTKEVVSSFPDTRVRYIYQENRGVSAAQNVGISASRGEYIAFLGADDIWLPQKLELQERAMDSNPQAGVVYSDLYYLDSATGIVTGTFFQQLKFPPPRGRVLNWFTQQFFGHPSTLLVRRDVFARVGMFDEALSGAEDNDMLFRIASHFEFEVICEPLIKYRRHASQVTQQTQIRLGPYIAYLHKAIQFPDLNKQMRARLRRSLAVQHFRYGRLLIRRGQLSRGAWEMLSSIKAHPLRFGYSAVSYLGEKLTRSFALCGGRRRSR